MSKPFSERIALMNAMYRLPANARPTLPDNAAERLVKFKATLMDEVHEIDDIAAMWPRAPIKLTCSPRLPICSVT